MISVVETAFSDAARSSDQLEGVVRPRVALLSMWSLEPADNGRKQRSRHMIDALAPDYDITLISLLPPTRQLESEARVPNVARQYTVTLHVDPPSDVRRTLSEALRRYPRSQVAIWSADVAREIQEIVTQDGVSLVIGADLRTLRFLAALGPEVGTLLDEPDVSPFVVSGAAPSLRARAREQKYRWLLRDLAQRLDGVIAASDLESIACRTLADGPAPTVIENGVAALPKRVWTPPDNVDLLYTGSVAYAPNAEAVEFMRCAVLPLIASQLPQARLLVTGAPPERDDRRTMGGRIRFTGVLPDISEALLAARLFVCPLFSGTGTRIKLIEAMAHGLPIVTTSKGAEGLAVRDGVHLVVADSAREFALATGMLLDNPRLCLKLGANARQLVAERYTWAVQGARLRELVGSRLAMREVGVAHG
jgi:glycosyltransferase involved in cell wall biosynthesis